jgi:hypothetical protein
MRPDLTSRELVKHLAVKHSQTRNVVGLLESMQEPMKPKELAQEHAVERRVVPEITDPLEPWGVERTNDAHRQITTAGEAARQAFATALETIDADKLAWLARSENREDILDHLQEEGPDSAQGMSEIDGFPDKKTIHRTLDAFDERGWANCEEQQRSRTLIAHLTMDGERAGRVYDDLIAKMTQVIDKAPCLRDLYLGCADIPLETLGNAEIVEATPENPFRIEKRLRELSSRDFQHFRGFQSHWNGENAKAYIEAVRDGKEFEVVSRPVGLDEFPTNPDEVKCVIDGLRAENYHWLMHTDGLPCSLAIFDRQMVVVGPRDPGTTNNIRTGALFSQDDDLIDWAVNLYELHRQQAENPFDISIGVSIGINDLVELLHSRYLNDDESSQNT